MVFLATCLGTGTPATTEAGAAEAMEAMEEASQAPEDLGPGDPGQRQPPLGPELLQDLEEPGDDKLICEYYKHLNL